MDFEHELNRQFLFNADGEPIGETNYVVPTKWLIEDFKKNYADVYEDLDTFLDEYEPEDEGEEVYQRAKAEGVLVEDKEPKYYET